MAQLINKNTASRAKRLRAFSLFESVVAIAIISVLIGIGTLVYSNLVESERPIPYYQAKEEIDRYFHLLQTERTFFSRVFDHDSYSIEQHVDFYNGNKKLYLVEYVVKAQNEIWLTEKHLIANANEIR